MEKQWKKLLFPLISQIRYSVDSLNLINKTIYIRKLCLVYYGLIVARLVVFVVVSPPFFVCVWLHACLHVCLQRFSFKSKELQG